MFKYAAMLAGILIMCVPDDASVLRFIVQGAVGLGLFVAGVVVALEEDR